MQRLALIATVFLVFTIYTVLVAIEHGPLGFFAVFQAGGWHTQVFIDLALALFGFYALAVPDAKRRGISAWPYFIASLMLGSIAMLAYMLRRELTRAPEES